MINQAGEFRQVYDDILGDKKEVPEEVSKDSIIESQRVNIEAKQELIDDLVNKITALERHIESLERI